MDEARYLEKLEQAEDPLLSFDKRYESVRETYGHMLEFGGIKRLLKIVEDLRLIYEEGVEETIIDLHSRHLFLLNQMGFHKKAESQSTEILQHLDKENLDPLLKVKVLHTCFNIFDSLGQNERLVFVKEGLETLKDEELTLLTQAHIYYMLGTISHRMCEADDALSSFNKALSLAREDGNLEFERILLVGLSAIYAFLGDGLKPQLLYEESKDDFDDRLSFYLEYFVFTTRLNSIRLEKRLFEKDLSAWLEKAVEFEYPLLTICSQMVEVWFLFVCEDYTNLSEKLGKLVRLSPEFNRFYSHHIELLLLWFRVLKGEAITFPSVQSWMPEMQPAQEAFYQWIAGKPIEVDTYYLAPLARWFVGYISQLGSPLIVTQQISQGFCVMFPDGEERDLSRRPHLSNILLYLDDARKDGRIVGTVELFEVGWPAVDVVPKNGVRRVYSELHRLREWGVEIRSIDQGYRLGTWLIFLEK